jgi:hypothetical protein
MLGRKGLAKPGLAVTSVLLVAMGSAACATGTAASASRAGIAAATPSPKPTVANKFPGCKAHLNDGANAKTKKFTKARGTEYGEISLICGPGVATMYNTTYMNNSKHPGSPDPHTPQSAPLVFWNSFSQDSLALDYSVPSVLKNGPRFWVNDWITLPVGPTLYFSGIYARWFAYPAYPAGISKIFGNPKGAYKKTTIARKSVFGFNAGTSIFVLVDPKNGPYVMQAGSSQFKAGENINTLMQPGFAGTLHLPSGWKYKVIKITKPLSVQAVGGKATVTTDYWANTYDSCTSPSTAACSYNPLTGK